jgi:hypothetical protein
MDVGIWVCRCTHTFSLCKPRAMFNGTECAELLHTKVEKRLVAQFWRIREGCLSNFGACVHTLGFPETFVNLTGLMNQRRANAVNGMC